MRILIYIVFILSLLSCNKEEHSRYHYQPPPLLNDSWRTGTLAEANIDEAKVIDIATRIQKNEFTDIHSMLIIRNGKLVFEEYFNGFKREDYHVLYSSTKSYSSALIGIAIDKGFISSADALIKDFFPTKSSLFTGVKSTWTLAHLLTMSSGFYWDEWSTAYSDSRNSIAQMVRAPSQIGYVLSLPFVHEPGEKFAYSTGASNLMAPILEYATKLPVKQFAKENLFDKLNIRRYQWDSPVVDQYPSTGGLNGGLKLMPRDMAKLGQLYLDKGVWDGEKIISEEWINQSIYPHINAGSNVNYGYQWWTRTYFRKSGNTIAEFDAVGDGGQWIFVFPDLQLIVAFTGGNYTWEKGGSNLMYQPVTIVQKFLLPAVN